MTQFSRARWVALSFGFISICYGSRALIFPDAFAIDFGLPPEASTVPAEISLIAKCKPETVFIVATGGRTIAIGIAVTLLALENQLRAAGTVTLGCAVSGMIDAVNCYLAGSKTGLVLQHVAGMVVLSTTGMWLRSK